MIRAVVNSEYRHITIFLGIDLAWQSDKNHTGAAAFEGDEDGVVLRELSSGLSTLGGVHEFIRAHESSQTVVAVDAPLIINNETGQRPCEKMVTKQFGGRHAGAHPSNRSLYPDAGSVKLALALEQTSYAHCSPGQGPRRDGRWFCEVYPHPAHVVLFNRSRIIKYKRGLVAQRRLGLMELQREIERRIFGPSSPFKLDSSMASFLHTDLLGLRGRELKHHEDLLDSILCAYIAFHMWSWAWQKNKMLGDLDSGYIVIPTTELPSAVQ